MTSYETPRSFVTFCVAFGHILVINSTTFDTVCLQHGSLTEIILSRIVLLAFAIFVVIQFSQVKPRVNRGFKQVSVTGFVIQIRNRMAGAFTESESNSLIEYAVKPKFHDNSSL